MIGLIFDLDGTLVDSKKGIIESFNFAFKKIFKKPPEFEISDLNTAHTDQLWDLAKLEEKNLKLQKENEELREFAGGVVQVEKKIKQRTKQESVDN